MKYILLLLIPLMYIPLTTANKFSSSFSEGKAMLFKVSFYRAVIGAAIGAVILMFGEKDYSINKTMLFSSALFGINIAVCTVMSYLAYQHTTVTVNALFAAASVIIPTIFGVIWFNEPFNFYICIGFVCFVSAMGLIVSNKSEENKTKFSSVAFFACLGVFLTSGFGSVSMQIFSKTADNGNVNMFMFFSYVFDAAFALLFYLIAAKKEKNGNKQKMDLKNFVLCVIGMGAAFFIQALQTNLADRISGSLLFPVVSGSSVIISAVVGFLIFGEKLSLKNVMGILLGIISLCVIGLN